MEVLSQILTALPTRRLLSTYDLDSTHERFYEITHDPYLLETGINDLEYAYKGSIDFIYNFTGIYFYNWLKSIKFNAVIPDLNISKNDLFINFNYTNTLQTVYKIPNNRVLHIHGALKQIPNIRAITRDAKDVFFASSELDQKETQGYFKMIFLPDYLNFVIRTQIQFGANQNPEEEKKKLWRMYASDEDFNDYLSGAINVIEDFIDRSTKNVYRNFETLKSFIKDQSIHEVVVMGHSLSDADCPYYSEVLVPHLSNELWVFKSRQDNSSKINRFIDLMKLKNTKIEKW